MAQKCTKEMAQKCLGNNITIQIIMLPVVDHRIFVVFYIALKHFRA